MSFYRKTKPGGDTATKPAVCRRCHQRAGTTQLDEVALSPAALTPIVTRNLWFCDRCLDEIGRSKPRNS